MVPEEQHSKLIFGLNAHPHKCPYIRLDMVTLAFNHGTWKGETWNPCEFKTIRNYISAFEDVRAT